MKKLKKTLKDGDESDLPPRYDSRIDKSKDDGKNQQHALDRNELAVVCFQLHLQLKVLSMLLMVVDSMQDTWLDGQKIAEDKLKIGVYNY